MSQTSLKRIHITPDSELDRLLAAVGDEPLLLEKDGVLYRLVKEDDIWVNYDVERARAALRASAGALAGVDREQLLADLRAVCGQASFGRPG